MTSTVPHVTAWAGRTKYHADGFLLVWVYTDNSLSLSKNLEPHEYRAPCTVIIILRFHQSNDSDVTANSTTAIHLNAIL